MAKKALDFSKLKALVIDDSQFMRLLMYNVLNYMGVHDAKMVSSLKAGYDIVLDYDIIIVDYEFEAEKTGSDFIKAIRSDENESIRTKPMIAVTGNTTLPVISELLEAGVNEIIAKPITPRSVYSKLSTLVQKPRPFFETDDYFGPDRRRRNDPNYTGEERRSKS